MGRHSRLGRQRSATRMVRGLGLTRNPLRRGSDRVEAWLTVLLLVTLIIGAPWVCVWSARSTYATARQAQAWDKAHRFPVVATLTGTPFAPTVADGPVAGTHPMAAQARWTAADGTVRTGLIGVMEADRVGGTRTIWIDERGEPTDAPRKRYPGVAAAEVAVAALACVLAVLAAIRAVVRRLLDRHRMRSWDAEWIDTGPRWTGRR